MTKMLRLVNARHQSGENNVKMKDSVKVSEWHFVFRIVDP